MLDCLSSGGSFLCLDQRQDGKMWPFCPRLRPSSITCTSERVHASDQMETTALLPSFPCWSHFLRLSLMFAPFFCFFVCPGYITHISPKGPRKCRFSTFVHVLSAPCCRPGVYDVLTGFYDVRYHPTMPVSSFGEVWANQTDYSIPTTWRFSADLVPFPRVGSVSDKQNVKLKHEHQ